MSVICIVPSSASMSLVTFLPNSLGHSEGASGLQKGLVFSTHVKHHQTSCGLHSEEQALFSLHPRGKYWPSSAVGQDSVTIHCALFIVHSIGGTESRSYLTLNIAQLIGACSQHRAERQKQKPRKRSSSPRLFRILMDAKGSKCKQCIGMHSDA